MNWTTKPYRETWMKKMDRNVRNQPKNPPLRARIPLLHKAVPLSVLKGN
jgi:hypothetical protein